MVHLRVNLLTTFSGVVMSKITDHFPGAFEIEIINHFPGVVWRTQVIDHCSDNVDDLLATFPL